MRRELTPAARHGRRRPSSVLRTGAKLVAAVAAVGLVSTGCVGAIASWEVLGHAKPTVTLAMDGTSAKPLPQLTAQQGEVDMLLVATDTREGQGAGFDDALNQRASSGVGNNDSNLLVHISADHSSMAVVSFPRDLVVPIPACENDQGTTTPASAAAPLNTALHRGGEQHGLACVAKTIDQLTGLQIGYAGMITFDGVVAMADAVGGVDVCLATPIHDDYVTPALDLPAGDHNLSGAQAAAFLRSRHGVGDASDLARISNQQTFMAALARQTVSAHTLTDPGKVLRLAITASKHMTLSDTLADPTTLARLALAVNTVGLANMTFVQYPTVADPANDNLVIVAQDAAKTLDGVLQRDEPVVLGADSLGRSAVRSPSAAPTPAPQASAPAAQPSAPAQSTAPSPQAALPDSVSGQSAATVTCAAKR
ncbi:LCP family protein [Curtobacterium sp. 9128]|uniref:LCP family protein n=1 Tax=Curtobacterium sp. 9128 TaxID=1793722 RepID=UPI0011A9FA0A|nr:LCP family protein [Curtobacterium sp. 9128]